jgi:hypothetical protein
MKKKIALFLVSLFLFCSCADASFLIPDNSITVKELNSAIVDNSTIEKNVTNIKVKNGGIGTTQIASGAVTQEKRAALGQQISASSSSWYSASSSYVDVTNLTVTITTTGRPVFIGLVPDGSENPALVGHADTGEVHYKLVIDGSTTAGIFVVAGYGYLQAPVSSISTTIIPAAGSHTFKLQAKKVSGGQMRVDYCKLIAFEL